MLCFLCGKKIGFIRSLVDQQYCCAEHRKEARLASSQALREEEDVELWTVTRSRDKASKAGRSSASPAGQTASVFAFLTVGGLLVAALMLPGPAPQGGNAFPSVSLDPGVKPGVMSQAYGRMAELIRQRAPITLHADFRGGIGDWTTTALRGTNKIDDP